MTTDHRKIDADDSPGLLRRYGLALVVGCTLLGVAGTVMVRLATFHGSKVAKADVVWKIKLLPELPPPITKTPEVVPEKMLDQPPVLDPEKLNDKPVQPDPGPTTDLKGSGPGMILPPGQPDGGGVHPGGTGKSRFGWYAAEVQRTIGDALRQNALTRNAAFQLEVRVWTDLTGRITRSFLDGTTGDTKIDDAIQRNVLDGLQLQEPPPQDMPMPIVMRFTLSRPQL